MSYINDLEQFMENIGNIKADVFQPDETTMGIYVGNPKQNRSWKFISNTPEDIQQAIKDGYTSKSMLCILKGV
jgi:hypothetical protein